MKTRIFLFILSILSLGPIAFAKDGSQGWITTPYLGYASGSTSTKTTAAFGSSTGASTFTEIPAGLQLGYSFGTFWLAADVQYGASGTTVTTQPTGQPNSTYTRLGLGVDLGLRFGMNNVYLTYFPSNTITNPAQNGATASTVAATGMGLTYLYHFSGHFAAGLFYSATTPTSFTSSGTTTQWSTLYSTYTNTSYGLTLAFPLMN